MNDVRMCLPSDITLLRIDTLLQTYEPCCHVSSFNPSSLTTFPSLLLDGNGKFGREPDPMIELKRSIRLKERAAYPAAYPPLEKRGMNNSLVVQVPLGSGPRVANRFAGPSA